MGNNFRRGRHIVRSPLGGECIKPQETLLTYPKEKEPEFLFRTAPNRAIYERKVDERKG